MSKAILRWQTSDPALWGSITTHFLYCKTVEEAKARFRKERKRRAKIDRAIVNSGSFKVVNERTADPDPAEGEWTSI
jgi:hypothetical protein